MRVNSRKAEKYAIKHGACRTASQYCKQSFWMDDYSLRNIPDDLMNASAAGRAGFAMERPLVWRSSLVSAFAVAGRELTRKEDCCFRSGECGTFWQLQQKSNSII